MATWLLRKARGCVERKKLPTWHEDEETWKTQKLRRATVLA
jgi:hypothetical protein